MGSLSKNQIEEIEDFIKGGGLTFNPLKDELLDHIISDLEMKIEEGQEFQVAWLSVKKEIPTNHLKHIERETMETINSKFNIANIFTKISIGLLIVAAFLKILRLPGAVESFVLFFTSTCFTLLVGSARSTLVYRERQGRFTLSIVAISLIVFIASLCFKTLRLPGANELTHFSVLSIAIVFPLMSFYFFYSKKKLKDHLLIMLTERNQKILETVSVVLVGFGLLFYYSSGPEGKTQFMGAIFMIFTVLITGLSVFMRSWVYYVKMDDEQSKGVGFLLLVSSVMAIVMFILPAWGPGMDLIMRNLMAYGAFTIYTFIVIVHYQKYSTSRNRNILVPLSSLMLFFPFFKLGENLGWLQGPLMDALSDYYIRMAQVTFLCILLVVFRREPLFKALVIMTIASGLITMG